VRSPVLLIDTREPPWPILFADSPRIAAAFAWRFLCGPVPFWDRTGFLVLHQFEM
jgi:hypothetical protein